MIDSKDRIWIGTFGGGINLLEKDKNNQYKIKVYDITSGLCDDNITAIIEDDNQNIWVSTYNGISRIDNSFDIIQNFFAEDGITNNEFNYTSSLKDNEGNIWFGSMNGITVIDPNKDLGKSFKPIIDSTSFSNYNRKTNKTFHQFNALENVQEFIISPLPAVVSIQLVFAKLF